VGDCRIGRPTIWSVNFWRLIYTLEHPSLVSEMPRGVDDGSPPTLAAGKNRGEPHRPGSVRPVRKSRSQKIGLPGQAAAAAAADGAPQQLTDSGEPTSRPWGSSFAVERENVAARAAAFHCDAGGESASNSLPRHARRKDGKTGAGVGARHSRQAGIGVAALLGCRAASIKRPRRVEDAVDMANGLGRSDAKHLRLRQNVQRPRSRLYLPMKRCLALAGLSTTC